LLIQGLPAFQGETLHVAQRLDLASVVSCLGSHSVDFPRCGIRRLIYSPDFRSF
jgi:hypothetical protein